MHNILDKDKVMGVDAFVKIRTLGNTTEPDSE